LTLHLKPTQDIAATLGKMKREKQIVVGFALETEHETENAQEKLERKQLDFIVLNSLRNPQAGFGYDTNQITIIDKQGANTAFPMKNKREVAKDIIDAIQTQQ
jgi:phosphopantothenoylcysteine decarboxylase/phosphopantothenate--cysteine ligase